jgi:hypothetical protein
MVGDDQIGRARAIRIEDEIKRHGIKLKRAGQELIGPCPRCGGKDRFSINIRKQLFNCRGCETGGDVIALVQFLHRCDFTTAIGILTGDDHPAIRTPLASSRRIDANDDAERVETALVWWAEGKPIGNTLAELYLWRRGFRLPLGMSGRVLKYHEACPFGPDVKLPCLLSLLRDIRTDEPRAIMRTAIAPGGAKIGRKAFGPIGGAAIKLTDDADVSYGLTIGEGLETTLRAMLDHWFVPAWALGSAQAIAKFPVLAGIDCLTILVDNDADGKGPGAALECSARWRAAGREVKRVVPNEVGQDMADLLPPERFVS